MPAHVLSPKAREKKRRNEFLQYLNSNKRKSEVLVILTKHAKRKILERMGVHKGDMYKVAWRAFTQGTNVSSAEIPKYKPEQINKRYGNHCFVFVVTNHIPILITILEFNYVKKPLFAQ